MNTIKFYSLCLLLVLPIGIAGCSSQKKDVGDAISSASSRKSVYDKKTYAQYKGAQANAEFFRKERQANLYQQANYEVENKKIDMGSSLALGKEKIEQEDGPEEIPVFSDIFKRDIKALPRSLWQDTKRVYTNKDNLMILMLGGGASLAVRNTVDERWEDQFRRHRSFRPEWGDTAGVLGNPGVHLALAAAQYYFGGKSGDTRTYHVGKTLFNALIINDLSTVLLKAAASTRSPNGEGYSWPSGHVSSTVCLAAVMDKYYGHKVGIPLYLLSGFVGFERMDDREHNFSDIVFGAVLGYVVGKTVADGHSPELLGGKIYPYATPSGSQSGVVWVREW